MKRATFLLMICLAVCQCTLAATASDSVKVSNYDEFIAALKSDKSYIQLTADINMANLESSVEKFTGEIDGLEYDEAKDEIVFHTLKNLHESLAVSMDGAYIHNVNFADCDPKWHATSVNEGMGVICRNSTNCRFSSIQFDNVKVSYSGFWKGTFINPIRHYNGGIVVGKDNGSTFRNLLITNSYVYVSSTEGGGVVGDSYNSTFENITMEMNSAVHVEGSDNLADGNAGGIAGRAENSSFTNCINRANVTAALDNVGGIAGKASKGCSFKDCENSAYVAHMSVSDPSNLLPLTTSLSLSAVSNAGINIFHEVGAMKLNGEYALDYAAELGQYQFKMDKWQEDWNSWKDLYDYVKNEPPTSISRTNIDKHMMDLEIDKPQAPEMQTATCKYSTAATVFTFALMAAQVAQMVYEAQDEDNVGGIVGRMVDGGSILGCVNYGMVRCDDAFSGGIAGETSGGVIIDCCHNAGIVKGYEQTGGIVGKASGGKVRNCLNTGNIDNGNSSKDTFGMICGEQTNGASFFHNCYTGETDGADNDGCRSISPKTFASGAAAVYLNSDRNDNYWRQKVGTDFYPAIDSIGTVITAADVRTDLDGVFHVSNIIDLLEACTNPYANIILDDDVDVSSHLFGLSSGFMPFRGTIDGQNHKICNIAYTVAAKDHKFFQNDNHESRVGFFQYAREAEFNNLTLENFQVTIGGGQSDYLSLFVADSKQCKYNNIHLTGISKVDGLDTGYAKNVAGLVGMSDNDTFTDCSTGSSCSFKNHSGLAGTYYTRPVGGLVAHANGSSFTRCLNAATLYGDWTDYAGGIIARDEGGSTLTGCYNSGTISAEEYVGGLVGYGDKTTLTECVNTGVITTTNNKESVGGIAGQLEGSSTMRICYNFGDVKNTKSSHDNGALAGINSGTESDCLYYCTSNGSLVSNTSDLELSQIKSGQWVVDVLNSKKTDDVTWYQSVDDNYSFLTHYPVPIPDAGVVYRDVLCDDGGTITYSNRYHAEADHTRDVSSIGFCNVCGYLAQAPEADAVVDIYTNSDLINFSTLVENDTYSTLSARLMADIDLADCSYPTIGSLTMPYKGTFNGRGHRIKNMNLTAGNSLPCGFFTCIGDGAEIDSLVIDSTCSISGSGYPVAGVVACAQTSHYGKVTIRNCANEATITGAKNAAGILGCVGLNTGTTADLTISNCYNTGTVTGSSESASICAWAQATFTIENCYNIGAVNDIESGKPLYRYAVNGARETKNCYDINGSQIGVEQITAAQVASGELCWKLNGSSNDTPERNGFYQRLDSAANNPELVADKKNIVESFDRQYCTGTTCVVYYNPSRNNIDLAEYIHEFDENGFCTAKAGETHYETPDTTLATDGTVTYKLSKVGHLYWLAQQVNSGLDHPNCILVNDIVDNKNLFVDGDMNPDLSDSDIRKWTPIGTEEHPYMNATFNGNGHTISGLYYNNGEMTGVGLFGFAYNMVNIKNVGVIDSYFAGKNGVGTIVGWGGISYTDPTTWTSDMGPHLLQCFSTGIVQGTDYVGGLAGFINDGKAYVAKERISSCYSAAKVTGDSHYGGLFGYMGESVENDDPLNNCYWNDETCTGSGRSCYGTCKQNSEFACGKICEFLNLDETEPSVCWSQDIASQKAPLFGTGGAKLSRTVGDQKLGTVVLPFTVYSTTDLTYFTIDTIAKPDNEEYATIKLTKVDQVPANTPCFFYNNKDTSVVVFESDYRDVTVPTQSTADLVKIFNDKNGNKITITFSGAYQTKSVNDNQYVLSDDQVMWNKLLITASDVQVEPYHAYIGSAEGGAFNGLKRIYIVQKGADFDFNEDGFFNELDVSFINSIIAGSKTTDKLYDANNDGKCTMSDVMTMTKRLINPETLSDTPPSSTEVITGK